MITIPSIRALVCDLDGVIRHYDTDAQVRIDRAYGLIPETIARIAFGPRHLMPAISGKVSDDEWRSGIAGELAAMIGESQARDAVAAWSADIGTVDWSVLELLRQVRRRCPVIILSNATTRLRNDLSSLGLDREVDAVVSSAETGSPKPQREAFVATDAAVERLLGYRPEPQEILFVDDSPEHVDAGARHGWRTSLFTDTTSLAALLS